MASSLPRARGTGSLKERTDASGRRTWYGVWRDASGRQYQRVLGPVRVKGSPVGLSKTEANEELRKRISAGRHADARVTPQSLPLTVESVGGLIMERQRLAGRRPATIRAFEVNVRVHLAPFFGSRGLAEITRADVDALMSSMLAQGKSAKTARNARGDLAHIFNHAIREDWLQANPVAGAVRPRSDDEGGKDLRFLDVESVYQLARLGPQDDELGRNVERDLYLVAAMTGMRQGELIGLACAQVDFAAGVIRVVRQVQDGEFGPTKGKKRRFVPMAEPVAQALARRCADLSPEGLVFGDPETGLPLSRHRVTGTRFEAACRRAGVPRVTFHELRHTFGTTVARGGASLIEIMAWMGHEDLATTQKYLHYATRPSEAQLIGRAFALDAAPLADPVSEP
jgi:integrase